MTDERPRLVEPAAMLLMFAVGLFRGYRGFLDVVTILGETVIASRAVYTAVALDVAGGALLLAGALGLLLGSRVMGVVGAAVGALLSLVTLVFAAGTGILVLNVTLAVLFLTFTAALWNAKRPGG